MSQAALRHNVLRTQPLHMFGVLLQKHMGSSDEIDFLFHFNTKEVFGSETELLWLSVDEKKKNLITMYVSLILNSSKQFYNILQLCRL